MKSSGSPEFWALYRGLPPKVKEAARKTDRLWSDDPRHSSLRFKRVQEVWSVRIGGTVYRALAVDEADGFLWMWIGPHDEYERLIAG